MVLTHLLQQRLELALSLAGRRHAARLMVRVHRTSAADDPYKACIVEVEGPNQAAMVVTAKQEAAKFLREPFRSLVADGMGSARVVAYERFVQHLGVPARPIRWAMTVTIKLDPQIVKERREHARLLQAGEHPHGSEDGE